MRYYSQYNRCKFTEYCFYSHDVVKKISVDELENELAIVKTRLENVENKNSELFQNIEQKDLEINELRIKITDIFENEPARIKYSTEALENMIKEATENFALDFMNKQEALERRTIERIDVLSDQIRMITDLFKSSIPQHYVTFGT